MVTEHDQSRAQIGKSESEFCTAGCAIVASLCTVAYYRTQIPIPRRISLDIFGDRVRIRLRGLLAHFGMLDGKVTQ
jgi:hypothetical protein